MSKIKKRCGILARRQSVPKLKKIKHSIFILAKRDETFRELL